MTTSPAITSVLVSTQSSDCQLICWWRRWFTSHMSANLPKLYPTKAMKTISSRSFIHFACNWPIGTVKRRIEWNMQIIVITLVWIECVLTTISPNCRHQQFKKKEFFCSNQSRHRYLRKYAKNKHTCWPDAADNRYGGLRIWHGIHRCNANISVECSEFRFYWLRADIWTWAASSVAVNIALTRMYEWTCWIAYAMYAINASGLVVLIILSHVPMLRWLSRLK